MHLAQAGYGQRALEVIREVNESYRGQAIAWAVPYLNESQRHEALNIARAIEDVLSRMQALGSLVRNQEQSALQEAWETLQAVADDRQWIQSVIWLIPHLREEVKVDLLWEGLMRARRLPEGAFGDSDVPQVTPL